MEYLIGVAVGSLITMIALSMGLTVGKKDNEQR